jgi:peptidoglycan/LPS O-acetylase OafA/YrhL
VIQQAFVFLTPAGRHWYIVFAVSLVIGTVFAAFSWRFIEKPALKLRKFLPHIEASIALLRAKRFKEA